jgi:16S rRNA (cytidine1402-2'-O)-methyltransferase
MALGTLYLIPSLLGAAQLSGSIPSDIVGVARSLRYFLVEDEKSARAFLKLLVPEINVRDLHLSRLNEHSKQNEIESLMQPLRDGHDVGVISEAGCPGIADPGAVAVAYAHAVGATVRPLVGPCSMTLALMGSGFNGQRWRFVGYVPVDSEERRATLCAMERDLNRWNETQIMMDTPYRNQKLLHDIITSCSPQTKLCVALGLTTPEERITVHTIATWRRLIDTVALPKVPALFLLGRYSE